MSDPLMPVPTRQGLVARIQAILLKPAETWDLIAVEPATIQSIFVGYVVPLAAIGPICGVLASLLFVFVLHLGVLWAVLVGAVTYGLSLVMVYAMAFVVDALAPSFDGQKNMLNAFKLVAYAGTASYIAGVFQLLPMLGGLLALVAFVYSIYLFYLGLPKLMKNPAEKSVVYIAVVAICGLVMAAIVWSIVAGISAIGLSAAILGGNHLSVNGPGGTITVQDKTGSATINVNQMAAAANQMAAQASAIQQNGTVTGAPVKVADAQALLDLTPAIFNGATRADTSTSSGGVAGMAASTAEATYTIGGGSIHLKVSDIGSMAGVGAMANAMNINTSSSSAGGYDTTSTQGNRIIHERYNAPGKNGEYDIILNGRVAVDATGNNVDMATLKSLVAQVDLDKADSLTK